jgi:hypothetical protein
LRQAKSDFEIFDPFVLSFNRSIDQFDPTQNPAQMEMPNMTEPGPPVKSGSRGEEERGKG